MESKAFHEQMKADLDLKTLTVLWMTEESQKRNEEFALLKEEKEKAEKEVEWKAVEL